MSKVSGWQGIETEFGVSRISIDILRATCSNSAKRAEIVAARKIGIFNGNNMKQLYLDSGHIEW